MVRFMTCFQTILEDEGGWKFTDDPNDPGGMTYGGMTWRKLNEWLPEEFSDDLSQTTFRSHAEMNDEIFQDDITACYREEFWERAKCDELPPIIDELFFSMVVNLGVRQGTKILQRGINGGTTQVTVDGVIGPQTIKVVSRLNDEITNLPAMIINAWEDKYINLVVANAEAWRDVTLHGDRQPKSFRAKYLRGWINRTRKYETRYT